MATIIWPAALPRIFRTDGFQDAPADQALRTQMDEGPDKVRTLPTADLDSVSGTLLLTVDQWKVLKNFYKETAKGVLPFEWIDHLDGRIVDYRFKGPPTATPFQDSQLLLIQLTLEIIT